MKKLWMFALAAMFIFAGLALAAETGSIVGKVTDTNGVGVGDVNIVIVKGDPGALNRKVTTPTAKSDKEPSSGEFRIDNLRPGVYDIKVDGKRIVSQTIPNVTVTGGAEFRLDVKVVISGGEGEGYISGTVYNSQNKPLKDVKIEITSGPDKYQEKIKKDANLAKPVTSDESGKFTLKGLPSGQYNLKATMPDGSKVVEKTISVRDGKEKTTQIYMQ